MTFSDITGIYASLIQVNGVRNTVFHCSWVGTAYKDKVCRWWDDSANT